MKVNEQAVFFALYTPCPSFDTDQCIASCFRRLFKRAASRFPPSNRSSTKALRHAYEQLRGLQVIAFMVRHFTESRHPIYVLEAPKRNHWLLRTGGRDSECPAPRSKHTSRLCAFGVLAQFTGRSLDGLNPAMYVYLSYAQHAVPPCRNPGDYS